MSKLNNIILIVGVSGVGKTYAINSLKKSSESFTHFSAGTLIKKRRAETDRDALRLLNSSEILQNQYLLIEQFKLELKAISPEQVVLFDAHMLIHNNNELITIPLDIFQKLNPYRFIFLHDDPEIILSRRDYDASRERQQAVKEDINYLQERSFKMAQAYASKLSIGIQKVTPDELLNMKSELLADAV